MRRLVSLAFLFFASAAFAQSPPLNESAQTMLGAWEFSNAARDKTCTATFKDDRAAVGYRVEFDAHCATLFPLVANIAGWRYPDDDLLYLLDAQGQALVEFSEVEDGMFEAPTEGVGVLFLHNPATIQQEQNEPPEEATPPDDDEAPQGDEAPAPKGDGG